MGADDYLTKPVSPRELVLRVKAILRRSQKVAMTDELRVGDFVVDRQNMVLTVAGRLAELTSTELKLVSYLMSNPDVVHSRSELLNAVWGYADDTHSRTLDTHVKRLRDKLGDHGVHIGTVRKQGYLFVSNVRKETAA
jgi:two-component system phosphate regulon response regulator PhoB